MLERYAICVKLSADKRQCQLIYIEDPLALECRPIPKGVEQNINIGSWVKDGKTLELTEDGPFLTSITAEWKILITIPLFFPPSLSSLSPNLHIPDHKEGTLYFHAPLTGDGRQIQGEWKPNRKVKKNHIYNGKFEIELQDEVGTPKWTLLEIYDQSEGTNGPISQNSALFVNGTCQQGQILKINGHLAIILGEDEKLVYTKLEFWPIRKGGCAVGDFIEYKQMNITFNGAFVPIGIKCNGKHCHQIGSDRKNLLKKISTNKKDNFRIRLDAANWGQQFEPASNRIKGIGTLTCLPQHSAQLCSPKTLPIFIKVQALFYYEFHSVLWTVLEISDNEQSILGEFNEANSVKKCAEKMAKALSTLTPASSLESLDNWASGKNIVFLCKKGDEAILMEFSIDKKIKALFQMKLSKMPTGAGVGQCMEMDYKISTKGEFVRKSINGVGNVKKLDDVQFVRSRVVEGWTEFLAEFYECTDPGTNQYRTSIGLLFLPTGVFAENSFWCRLSDMKLGKVIRHEKVN